jgi:hypothetical protein
MNDDIRELIKKSRVRNWEVAQKIGVAEATFSRMLRYEITPEKKQDIIKAVNELKGAC